MHCIPRKVSVRPHQLNHCVRAFDALFRNNLYGFYNDAHLHQKSQCYETIGIAGYRKIYLFRNKIRN